MSRKKITSVIAVILAVLMVLTLVLSALPRAYAITQSDIDAQQEKRNELAAKVAEAQERLDFLNGQQAGVLDRKAALDELNLGAQESLNEVAQELAMYDEIIAGKSAELDEARDRENDQLNRYRSRVRAMEENGSYSMLSVIISSDSFAELLAALDDIGEIMESDKALERQYRAAREETERVKAEYEEIRTDCEEKQAELLEEKSNFEQLIADTNAELEALREDISLAIEDYTAAQEAEAEAAAYAAQLVAQFEEQKRREAEEAAARAAAAAAAAAANGDSDSPDSPGYTAPSAPAASSGFTWPVPSGHTITSRFGNRVDPFTGETRYHSGIDIDGYGNDGGPIVAAMSGTVITADSNSGYGNYIIIDHGNGYKTLYAHMSGFAITLGQWVEAGQTVGYLGATGRATGTHCHFEVFINGERTDPEQFFSGMTYWNC